MTFLVLLILVIVGYFFLKGAARAKYDSYAANRAGAFNDLSSDPEAKPCWHKDYERVRQFRDTLAREAKLFGIPYEYVRLSTSPGPAWSLLLANAAHMEVRGASFTDQMAGSCELLRKMWMRLDVSHKREFRELSAKLGGDR